MSTPLRKGQILKQCAAPRRTQTERSEATRTRLLDATLQCLGEHGYAGTTFQAVCEVAGVSRGAVLHHFGTKEALVARAFMHAQSRKLDEGPEMPAGVSVARELAIYREQVARWFPVSFAFYAELARNEALRTAFEAVCKEESGPVIDRFSQLQTALDGTPDPLAARYVIGCFLRGLELEGMMSDPGTVERAYRCFLSLLEASVPAIEPPAVAKPSRRRGG